MIGISSSWRANQLKSGKELLKALMDLGAEALELEYRVSEKTFLELKPLLKKEKTPVLSIHNVFPNALEETAFTLSAVEREERELAVKKAKRTIEVAADLEARAVVLHLGSVPMDSHFEEIFELYDEGKLGTNRWETLLEELLEERREESQKSFDAVLFSLDELNKHAEEYEIFLGVENRYFYHEIPNLEELKTIFAKFKGSNIRYWHDVGHAQVEQNFRWQNHKELLDLFSENLIGIHLHDVIGYSDHKAPGTGEVDFHLLKDYVKDDTIKVIEVFPEVEKEKLIQSLDFLKRIL